MKRIIGVDVGQYQAGHRVVVEKVNVVGTMVCGGCENMISATLACITLHIPIVSSRTDSIQIANSCFRDRVWMGIESNKRKRECGTATKMRG